MSPTRYLRPRATAPLDDATLAAAVAAVIGPPGLVRYPPRSPALFPPPHPRGLTVHRAGLSVVLGSFTVAGLLFALWPHALPPAVGMAALPAPTVPASATDRPGATATAPATWVAPTVTSPLPTATVVRPPAAPVRTMLPTLPLPTTTVRWVPPTAIPPRIPPPATATTRPVVRLPAPVLTVGPVIIPPVTPGSGPAGGDWSDNLYTRSATIHADPTP